MPMLDYYHQLVDLNMYDDQTLPEFYGSSSQLTANCYNPTPSHIDHGSINLDSTNRAVVPPMYGGYNSCTMQSMDPTLSMYPSQSIWQGSQTISDEKRGPVIMGQAPAQPPVKRKGGRKPKDDPNLPPMEKEKRRLRRLRNKEAAAKCRERRLNHTSSLLQQIEQLEKSQQSHEERISQLRKYKEDCEKLLESHSQECGRTFSVRSPSSASLSSQSSSSASSVKTPSPAVQTDTSHTSMQPSFNRRKQTNPRLNLDISCSDVHRRKSSSSSGDLQSPPIIH
ncbi:transcription factor kayak-like isoform X2 [Watersipora subatra]|uniref:transcription factor kayak-like isoform X2 n=1 Tax=Watersipora subatra TaxID=2589382 RepID=UPI00355B1C27